MKIATTTGDFNKWISSVDQAVELLSRTPFRYIDLSLEGKVLVGDDWESVIGRCGEIAAKKGLKFVQSHSSDIHLFDPKYDEELEMERFRRTLKSCVRLGIPNVVLHAPFNNTAPEDYPEGKERFFGECRRFLEALTPMIEEFGVEVLMENSLERHSANKFYFMTGAELREFVDWMDHPLIKAVWDTGHACIRGNDQYKDIVDLGDKLAAVHIHDNFGVRDLHTAPLFGVLDFDPIIRGLTDVGFQGYFTLEACNFPMGEKGFPYKRRLGDESRLRQVNLDLRVDFECLLYKIAKFMLDSYGIFEE